MCRDHATQVVCLARVIGFYRFREVCNRRAVRMATVRPPGRILEFPCLRLLRHLLVHRMMRRYTLLLLPIMTSVGCAAPPPGHAAPVAIGRSAVESYLAEHASSTLRPIDGGGPLSIDDVQRLGEVARASAGSVVYISALRPPPLIQQPTGHLMADSECRISGTGVVIDARGFILTAAHVVSGAAVIRVRLADGRRFRATHVVLDACLDLAVLAIECEGLSPLLPSLQSVDEGALVVALSARPDLDAVLHRPGIVTNPAKSIQNELDPSGNRDYDTLVESSTVLEPGFSGGPLLDVNGMLVGVNIAAVDAAGDTEATGYAIPFTPNVHLALTQLIGDAAMSE